MAPQLSSLQLRHPAWIRVQAPGGGNYARTHTLLKEHKLTTVCEEARCPNLRECWAHGTATVMLLGEVCTRGCRFCSVGKGRPAAPDPEEPARVAQAVAGMGLRHVVVTSVTRDDLPDGGAGQFALTVREIKARVPGCRVEVLIPDFRGEEVPLEIVVDSPIDILGHNLETVPRLYRRVRPGAVYERSLEVLERGKRRRAGLLTKAGLMLGLGETPEELEAVFRDLREVGCDILTMGQYLRPSLLQLPVERYLPPEEFSVLKSKALSLGFRHVESGPFVRSSYHAWSHVG